MYHAIDIFKLELEIIQSIHVINSNKDLTRFVHDGATPHCPLLAILAFTLKGTQCAAYPQAAALA